jgi:hypothetical protein
MEKALILLVEQGVSRQIAHEKIRKVVLDNINARSTDEISLDNMLSDPFFDKVIFCNLNILYIVFI